MVNHCFQCHIIVWRGHYQWHVCAIVTELHNNLLIFIIISCLECSLLNLLLTQLIWFGILYALRLDACFYAFSIAIKCNRSKIHFQDADGLIQFNSGKFSCICFSLSASSNLMSFIFFNRNDKNNSPLNLIVSSKFTAYLNQILSK